MIEFINVSKSYEHPYELVLDRINLTFHDGINVLMGASGRGKTTIANLIAGLIMPDDGAITGLKGQKVSYHFQDDVLLDWETALSNVLFVMKHPKNHEKQAIDLLVRAGLEDAVYKKAADLSGGMKRRAALCRALIAEYDVLLLDEPFKGLDLKIKHQIMDMVKQTILPNKIVICITHDPAEAAYLGGTVVYM